MVRSSISTAIWFQRSSGYTEPDVAGDEQLESAVQKWLFYFTADNVNGLTILRPLYGMDWP